MRKLILMSILFATVVAPWQLAGGPGARKGMKWTVVFMLLFILAWAELAPRFYFSLPAPED